jgi:hypothetical protein
MNYNVKFMQNGNICQVNESKNLTNMEVKRCQYPK